MDDLDRKLIEHLGKNARISLATLARRVGVARSTIQARIDRLETQGIIAGYTLRLGDAAETGWIRATVLLQVEPRATAAVLSRLNAMTSVELAHTTSGRFDLAVQVATSSPEALDAALDKIGATQGVMSSESLIHLSTKIDRRV